MIIIIIIIILLIIIISLSGACFESHTSYAGFPLVPNAIKNIDTVESCQHKCQENAECEYFTWIGHNAIKNKNSCHLKSAMGTVGTDNKQQGKLSGAKYCPDSNPSKFMHLLQQ